jgi:hypothetical protein
LTKFTLSYARRTSKYAAVLVALWAGLSFLSVSSAVADSTWQTSNGNVNGNSVQFDWRGGTATYSMNVPDGSTIALTINNTIANTIGWGTPTPDEWRVFINGQEFAGNTIEVRTITAVVSGNVVVSVYGKDIGFWGGWYGPIFYAPVIQSVVVSTPDTQTQVSQETSTSPSSPQETTTPVSVPESDTVPATSDSQTVVVAPSETQTSTSESSTQTIPSETSTPVVEIPLPTPVPAVEPQPVPVVVEPQPEPLPQPDPVPVVVEEPISTEQEAPLEGQPLEEQPVVEEQQPVEEPSELPAEEETNETPVEEPVIQEPSEPTPEPLPLPVAEPEPVIQPDVAYEPPTVTLDNGVILTQEVAEQVALLQNPSELLSELFTNPAAVFAALGSVGADMSPQARQKSKDAVVQAVVVGSIVTQAAGAAAYRRKP